jgi:hypothetical protein
LLLPVHSTTCLGPFLRIENGFKLIYTCRNGSEKTQGSGLGSRGGEDLLDRVRHGVVGVLEQETDLPHLSGREDMLKGGHSGEADAVGNLPISPANLVSAYVALFAPELRGRRVELFGEAGGLARSTVADGAPFVVDVGTRL